MKDIKNALYLMHDNKIREYEKAKDPFCVLFDGIILKSCICPKPGTYMGNAGN
jgi:hypothetical protein